MKIITSQKQVCRIKKIINNSKKPEKHYNDETLWTWIVVKILENPKNNKWVFDCLFNKTINNIDNFKIGFEVQPLSPRRGNLGNTEANTHLDLAIGNITNRGKVDKNSGNIEGSGIKYDSIDSGMVCFIEAKMFSDLSTGVTHDKFRNQMTRVIENLLCFQDDKNKFPDDICFTLLTPRAFRSRPKSRLYGYKFLEYSNDLLTSNSLIECDIDELKIKKRSEKKWQYPPILEERLKKLRLNWVTYEDIFEIFLKRSIDLLNNDKRKSTFNELTKRLFHNN